MISAGGSSIVDGGAIHLSSGSSDEAASGRAVLQTLPGGLAGGSGDVHFTTGSSHLSSGSLSLNTGTSLDGAGGNVLIQNGKSQKEGGDVTIKGGYTKSGIGDNGGAVMLSSGSANSLSSGAVSKRRTCPV